MDKEQKNAHTGHRQRLKDAYRKGGIDSLSDYNKLELLLFYAIPQRDTNPIAHALLEEFGSLSAVLEAAPESLCKVAGITENAALLIQYVGQLTAYAEKERAQQRTRGILDTTTKCAEYLMPHFFGLKMEVVYLLCLDAKCKVITCRRLGEGSVNTADVSIRRIVETALQNNATSVVLSHNHPCGMCAPSAEDETTTVRIWQALDAVSVQLADHIIISGGEFYSMAERGFFESFLR